MRASSIIAAVSVSASVLGVACATPGDAAPAATLVASEPLAPTAIAATPAPTDEPHEEPRADEPSVATSTPRSLSPGAASNTSAPPAIGMPFAIEDLTDDPVNPFGVVRWSLDRAHTGHSGIDLLIDFGAEFVAVGDGEIVAVKPSPDPRPGLEIVLLLDDGASTRPGEGWAFIYEHVELLNGIAAGTRVLRGQPLGVSPLTRDVGNHHLQITYLFNDYELSRDHRCLLDSLAPRTVPAWKSRWSASAPASRSTALGSTTSARAATRSAPCSTRRASPTARASATRPAPTSATNRRD